MQNTVSLRWGGRSSRRCSNCSPKRRNTTLETHPATRPSDRETKNAAQAAPEFLLHNAGKSISLNIDATSKIDVSAKGYLGAAQGGNGSYTGRTVGNTTTGGSYRTNGGSYGGLGGIYSDSNATNAVYGDPTDPNDLGSGGGADYYYGGNGGGLARLVVSTLNLDGSILADGGNGTASGAGGSGGGIRLDVGTLSGSGTISAKGGTSTQGYGSGGGGRIAVYFNILSFPSNKITASGGAAGVYGLPGTVRLVQQ